MSSLYFSRASDALASAQSTPAGVQNRLQVVASRLAQAKSLMISGGGTSEANNAHGTSVSGLAVIGLADTRSSANSAPLLAPASLGIILGDPNVSPLATQSAGAIQGPNNALPFELAGVSVTVGGRAASLISVTPSRLAFVVPAGVASGGAEVLVTLQEGYVSRGTTNIAATAPGIFTIDGSGTGEARAFNAANRTIGPFSVMTPSNFGTDKRTRVSIFATGISYGLANTNTANDVRTTSGVMLNLAESMTVEARARDGRTWLLPVEYAGLQGRIAGLDQVIVMLPQDMAGAGSVEITLVAGGQRSNIAALTIR